MQIKGNTAGIQGRGASFYPDKRKILFVFCSWQKMCAVEIIKTQAKRVVWQVLTYYAYYTSMRDHLRISDQCV